MMNKNLIGSYGINILPGYQSYVSQTGVVRWNAQTQSLEVMGSGNDWHTLTNNSHTTVSLDDDVVSSLLWIKKKQVEESELNALCEKHAGLKDLKEKFEVMLALVQNHEQNDDK